MPNILGTDDDDVITPYTYDYGTLGFDSMLIEGLGGNDLIFGMSGNDWLFGGADNDILMGEEGQDHLYGGTGDDMLDGGDGSDTLIGGAGADILMGEQPPGPLGPFGPPTGIDTASYADSDAAVIVSLALGAGSGGDAEGDVLIGIENLLGSDFDDTLTGDQNDNTLTGRYGGDTLDGGGGNDTLDGGDGDDKLLGGDNDDTLKGGDGIDVLMGDDGSDTADYSDSFESINVSLLTGDVSGGTAQGDILVSIENVAGGSNDDMLDGDNNDNVLRGMNGDDTLEGFEGADVLMGGDFIDPMDFTAWIMTLAVDGIDTASYEGSDVGVHVELAPSIGDGDNDSLSLFDVSGHGYSGHAEGDLLFSIENVIGSQHNDSLFGSDDANVLKGMEGGDQLYGFGGSDTLDGGGGQDTLVGGDKADMFKFSSEKECGISMATADQLLDFNESTGDQIDLSGIDANTGLRGHQTFDFIGNNVNFTGVGQVRYNDGYVEGNTDADLDPEFYIALDIALTPAMSDDGFVLV